MSITSEPDWRLDGAWRSAWETLFCAQCGVRLRSGSYGQPPRCRDCTERRIADSAFCILHSAFPL